MLNFEDFETPRRKALLWMRQPLYITNRPVRVARVIGVCAVTALVTILLWGWKAGVL
jgi:hypothetical protein